MLHGRAPGAAIAQRRIGRAPHSYTAPYSYTAPHSSARGGLFSTEEKKQLKQAGRIGAVGFCWGGGTVNMLATRVPDLGAAVPFYGSPAPAADVPKIKAPLQIHYAGADTRINAAWPDFEAALKAAGVKYEMFMYEGAQHGFNNDTTPRYDEKSAKLAWQRTVEFFNANLRK